MNLLLFYCYYYLINITVNLAHPITPAHLTALNLGDWLFGVVFAMMSFFGFVGSLYWAQKINKGNYSMIIGLNMALYGLGQFLFMIGNNVPIILFARSLSGFTSAGVFVGTLSLIINTQKDPMKAKVLANSALISVVGSTTGYFIGGMLGNHGVAISFWTQIGSSVLMGLLMYWFCMNVLISDTSNQPQQGFFASFKQTVIESHRMIWIYFVAVLLIGMAITTYDQSFNYFLKDGLNYDPGQIGLIKIIVGLATTLLNYTLIKLMIKRLKANHSIILLLTLALLTNACALLFDFIIFSVSLLVLTNLIHPFTQYEVSQLSENKDTINRYIGIYQAFKSLGSVFGALLASGLYSAMVMAPFYASIIIVLLALGLVIWFERSAYVKLLSRSH